jgi:hypothetical protein
MCLLYMRVSFFTSAALSYVTKSKLTQRKANSEVGEHVVLIVERTVGLCAWLHSQVLTETQTVDVRLRGAVACVLRDQIRHEGMRWG